MKNYWLLAFIGLFIISCGEKDLYEGQDKVDNHQYYYDDVFKETGCKVNEISTLKYIYSPVFIDKDGNRYLTGSRNVNDTETFWFSKYKPGGDLIWETTQTPTGFNNDHTCGMMPTILANGDILVACVVRGSSILYPKEMLPTILNVKTGKATFVKVKDEYKYSSVKAFDGFFICEISQSEADKYNPRAYLWATQISNDGTIIHSAASINSPDESSLFLNTNEFISVNNETIKRSSLKVGEGYTTWTFKPDLPEYSSYTAQVEKKEKSILVSYKLTLTDGSTKVIRYQLDTEDGTDYKLIYQVQLDKKNLEIQVADGYEFQTTLTPEDTSTPELTWKSSDEEIAIVNESGLVTARKEGKCIITVASVDFADVYDTCELTVIPPIDDIVFDEKEVTLLEGSEYSISYKLYPVGATHEIKWESENPFVATVDASGKVTAIAFGTTRIIASINNGEIFAECTVKVTSIQQFFTLSTSFMGSTGDGYVTGQAATGIHNGSDKTVELSKFVIYSNNIVSSQIILNESLKPGEKKAINNIQLRTIYRPSFVWFYTYNGKEYKSTYVFDAD